MQFQEPNKGYGEPDAKVPMVSITPAVEGVDHNGVVLGKWKAGLLQIYSDCIPNGTAPARPWTCTKLRGQED